MELRFPVSARRAYSPGPPHGLCQRGELGALAHSWMTRVLKEKENEAPKREKPNPWDLGKSWKGGGTRGLAVRLQGLPHCHTGPTGRKTAISWGPVRQQSLSKEQSLPIPRGPEPHPQCSQCPWRVTPLTPRDDTVHARGLNIHVRGQRQTVGI